MSLSIPYVELPELVVVPSGMFAPGSRELSLKPFGLLVALGVYAGAWLAARYGLRRGVSARALTSFTIWVVVSGFVSGHVLDVVFYDPARVLNDPWALVRLYDGLSSYGGFIGGVLGAFAWKLRYRTPMLAYADVVASALPVGWVFGRAGCAVVHDHPGIASQAWFAVSFPSGPRIDLGLVEMALTIPIALLFLGLRSRAWVWGFFVSVLAMIYAPLRFALDFWRIRERTWIGSEIVSPDARYFALTPAQWASIVLFGFGLALAFRVFQSPEGEAAFTAPQTPKAFRRARADLNPDAQGGGRDSRDER